jgi:hypothetical protein
VIAEPVATHLATPSSGFTIGSLGAVAEFFRGPGEAVQGASSELWAATAKGAIRITLRDEVVPLAYETLSARAGLWQHGVLFCLPEALGRGACRAVVTEIGPDEGSIRIEDRGALLFDLGLGQRNVDFCIRTADDGLIAALRSYLGRPVGAIMDLLSEASPHRVALSALGRIEVYQHLDRNRSPDGPHTYLLPPLLKSGRTHSANIPMPRGYLPCLALYPGHPLFDVQGRVHPFDADLHRAFQVLLADWGGRDYLVEKRRAEEAMRRGASPGAYIALQSRVGRAALRITIRQRMCTDRDARSWAERFD